MGAISQIYTDNHDSWLPDHARLWRYVPLRTLFAYLTGNIFIPSVELLRRDDPFEGEFHFGTTWFNTFMEDYYGERAEALDDWIHRELCNEWEKKQIQLNHDFPNYAAKFFEDHYFAFLRKTRYAWCWFLADRDLESESAAMWNNYGKQGVAVATTVGKLKAIAEATNREFAFGQMRYIRILGGVVREFYPDDPQDAPFLLKPHFLKRDEYKSENEVCFVTTGPDAGYPHPTGIVLKNVNPADWITEIRLWPRLKPLEEDSLREAVAKFAPDVPCACSNLFGATPSREKPFSNRMAKDIEEVFLARWQDGSDGIPPELKKL